MAAMLTRGGTSMVAALLALVLASPAFAKGLFKGTFGSEKFKSRKPAAGCVYSRSAGCSR
jgi:hypothetical protein